MYGELSDIGLLQVSRGERRSPSEGDQPVAPTYTNISLTKKYVLSDKTPYNSKIV